MHVSAEAFWAEKAGNSRAEYEDAFCPHGRLVAKRGASFRFAVADGATDACFSGIWAEELVRAYCEGLLEPKDLARALTPLQQRWLQQVRGRGSLPWYVEQKIEDGAFATLLGLTLESSSESAVEGTWRAIAVGDSCLFQLRDRDVIVKLPLSDAASFTNSPALLSSRPDRNEPALRGLRTDQGEWKPGDAFYLMTDALACWLLQQLQGRRVPWKRLEGFDKRSKRFRPWIDGKRAKKLMRNDDVTLVRVDIHRPWDL